MSELFNKFRQNKEIDKIEQWALDIGQHYGNFLSEEDIIRHMDFNHSDLPPAKKAVFAHEKGKNNRINDIFIRFEFRIGAMGTSGWNIPDKYDISALVNSEYYITHEHNSDATYVNFYFRLPQIIKEFQESYDEQMKKQLKENEK